MTPEEIVDYIYALRSSTSLHLIKLIDKGLADKEVVDRSGEAFYDSLGEEKLRTSQKIRSQTEIIRHYMRGMDCEDMLSLTELARQYSKDSPGYVIQSWMQSCNTLDFLRQWKNDMNGEFDDMTCEKLIHLA